MFGLGYKIGKLGYKETTISPNNNFEYNSIILLENDMQKIKNNQLNIFKNKDFNNEKIIAPHSKGTYKFYIQNKTNLVIKLYSYCKVQENFLNLLKFLLHHQNILCQHYLKN